MGPETDGPVDSVRGRGRSGRRRFDGSAPRGLIAPELCVLGAILVTLVVGVSFSGQAGAEDERPSRGEVGMHGSPVEGVAISPDGRTIASASRDGTVSVWDLASKRFQGVVARSKAGFSSVVFSPDGSILAAGGLADGVTLVDLATGTTLSVFSGTSGAVRDLAFSLDGTSLAEGGDDGVIRIWEVPSGRLTAQLRGHEGLITRLAFAPDGRGLASVGIDGKAIFWDLGTGRIREALQPSLGAITSLAFAGDSQSLALGGQGAITVHEIATGRSRTWRTHHGRVTALQFLPDNLGLASSGLDGSISFWSPSSTLAHPQSIRLGHKGGVKALAVSPDGTSLISGGNDDAIKLWPLSGPPDRSEAASVETPAAV